MWKKYKIWKNAKCGNMVNDDKAKCRKLKMWKNAKCGKNAKCRKYAKCGKMQNVEIW